MDVERDTKMSSEDGLEENYENMKPLSKLKSMNWADFSDDSSTYLETPINDIDVVIDDLKEFESSGSELEEPVNPAMSRNGFHQKNEVNQSNKRQINNTSIKDEDKSDQHGQPARKQHKSNDKELETDTVILQRRQKQIDYGKNTLAYDNYRQMVPIFSRTKHQPRTPDKYQKYSRRSWDTLIKIWRKELHTFEPSGQN